MVPELVERRERTSDETLIMKFIKESEDMSVRDRFRRTTLHYLVMEDLSKTVIQECINKIVDINAQDYEGNTSLHAVRAICE